MCVCVCVCVCVQGLVYLVRHGLVEDRAADIARFLHGARRIDRFQERRILEARADLLDEYVFHLYFTERALCSTESTDTLECSIDYVSRHSCFTLLMLSFTCRSL